MIKDCRDTTKKASFRLLTTTVCLFVVILTSNLTSNNAQAQNIGPSISVVPHTFDLSVLPGEKVRKKIKLYNQGEIAIPFKLRMVEFDAEEMTGDMELLETSEKVPSPEDWIEFDKKEFIIDPGQKESVNLTINVPNDAQSQGYYGVALFEADISTLVFNESRVQVIPKVGTLLMLKVGDEEISDETLKIVEYTVPDEMRMKRIEKVLNFFARPFSDKENPLTAIKSGKPVFVVKLKNDSTYHTKLSGKVNLSGLGWKVEDQIDFPEITILPGKTRQIEIKGVGEEKGSLGWLAKPSLAAEPEEQTEGEEKVGARQVGFGVMEANLNIESEEGIKKQKNQWLLVFSWWLVLLGILLLIVLFLLKKMIFKRKAFLKRREKISGTVFKEAVEKENLKKQRKTFEAKKVP